MSCAKLQPLDDYTYLDDNHMKHLLWDCGHLWAGEHGIRKQPNRTSGVWQVPYEVKHLGRTIVYVHLPCAETGDLQTLYKLSRNLLGELNKTASHVCPVVLHGHWVSVRENPVESIVNQRESGI